MRIDRKKSLRPKPKPKVTRTTRSNPRGRLLSRRVRVVAYDHVKDPDGRGITRKHDFGPGVELRAMPDGSLRLTQRDGRPLWAEE